MILSSSIVAQFKINLSYLEFLFIKQFITAIEKYKVWNIFTFYLNSINIQNFLLLTEAIR